MAGRLLALSARSSVKVPKTPMGCLAMSSDSGHDIRAVIGKREIVGFGFNGVPNYYDRPDFPMPAIRWKEPTPDLDALREKEKGDWRKLSKEEKKALYRASFRQTFAEFKAPTGEWKSVIGIGLFLTSFALWIYYGMKTFVYQPFPESFNEDNRKAQLRRILDLQVNPIQGISSKWDYENDDWKK